jgi:hypothetical protein
LAKRKAAAFLKVQNMFINVSYAVKDSAKRE